MSKGTVMKSDTAMKVPVGSVEFDNVSMQGAVNRIVGMAQKTNSPRYVCTGNLDHLVMLDRDPEFREVYRQADLVLADGAPVVWLSRLSPGGPLRERVTGSDLFWELARASAATGLRLFFLGGKPGAAQRAAAEVARRHPGALVCGTYCPPLESFDTYAEQSRIHAAVTEAQPDILLVGFGAPKQEKWIAANRDVVGVPVCVGMGGTFEMAAGAVRRAPLWMQRSGMEWAFRLLQEPARLWGRYLGKDLPFLGRLTVMAVRARWRGGAAPRADERSGACADERSGACTDVQAG